MSMGFAACAALRLQDFDKLTGSLPVRHSWCSARSLCFRRSPKFSSLARCFRANTTGFIGSLVMPSAQIQFVAIRPHVSWVTCVPPIAGLALALIEPQALTASSQTQESRAVGLLRAPRAHRGRLVQL